MKKLSLAILVALIVTACSKDPNPEPTPEPTQPPGIITLKAVEIPTSPTANAESYPSYVEIPSESYIYIYCGDKLVKYVTYDAVCHAEIELPAGDNYTITIRNYSEGYSYTCEPFQVVSKQKKEMLVRCSVITTASLNVYYDYEKFPEQYSDYTIEFYEKSVPDKVRLFTKSDYDRIIGICNHDTWEFSAEVDSPTIVATLKAVRLNGTVQTIRREFAVYSGYMFSYKVAFNDKNELDIIYLDNMPFGLEY